MKKRKHEMHSLDDEGRETDAHLHDPILGGGHELRANRHGRAEAKRIGFSNQELDEMYGPENPRFVPVDHDPFEGQK